MGKRMIKKGLLFILLGCAFAPVAFAGKSASTSKKTTIHRKPSDNGFSLPEKFEKGTYLLSGKLKMNSQTRQTFIYLFSGTETEVAILLEGGIPVEESYLLDGSIYKIEVEFFKSAPPVNSVGFFVKSLEMMSPDETKMEVWKKVK
jgi:hypothetical protein